MTTSAYNKPLPEVTPEAEAFWEYCKQHEFRLQRCADCETVRYPFALICPSCISDRFEWKQLSGQGTVYSFVVYHQVYHPGFKEDVPYAVGLIELAEGPRFLSNIVGCPLNQITVGMPVEVSFEDITEEFSLPKFRPAKA